MLKGKCALITGSTQGLANWRQFRSLQHRWFSIADTRAENAVYRSDRP